MEKNLDRYILDNFQRAMDYHYIQPYYQPVIRTSSRQLCSFEVLARWMDPEIGMIYPDEFIHVLEENDLTDVWTELYEALSEAEAALQSGDQEAINAAYERLSAAFQALKDELAKLGEDKVVIQEVEVEAKCDEKCHVWSRHLLWIILLIISAVLNVIFIVLVVLYFVKRKKNAADHTPLIDYDINDD